MNSIFTLVVYKYGAMWVFDDKSRGLEREPFVAGMPAIINRMVGPNVERFSLTFWNKKIPGGGENTIELTRTRKENGGNWYAVTEGRAMGLEGWLCPAMYKYFPQAPPRLYAMVEKIDQPKGAK